MIISCSTAGAMEAQRPRLGMSMLSGSGFDFLTLDMEMFFPEKIYMENHSMEGSKKNYAKEIPNVVNKIKQSEFSVPAVKAPCPDIEALKASIRVCRQLNAKYLIVPSLFSEAGGEDEAAADREYFLRLADEAGSDICVLLKNQCRSIGGHFVRGKLCDPTDALKTIESLNNTLGREAFGFCLDIQACSLCGQDMQPFARTLGGHLKAVIASDCDGHSDSRLLPFSSPHCTDWLGLFRGLREISFDGLLIMDAGDSLLLFSHTLRHELLKFAKSTADFFEWQITLERRLSEYGDKPIALFGAGNMCGNYMHCYKEQYPPVFTCDNNESLWGTKAYGLDVKPPKELLTLPEDSVVIICNMYYKEIEKQLRDMGIKNIMFFNDEFPKMFNYERREAK